MSQNIYSYIEATLRYMMMDSPRSPEAHDSTCGNSSVPCIPTESENGQIYTWGKWAQPGTTPTSNLETSTNGILWNGKRLGSADSCTQNGLLTEYIPPSPFPLYNGTHKHVSNAIVKTDMHKRHFPDSNNNLMPQGKGFYFPAIATCKKAEDQIEDLGNGSHKVRLYIDSPTPPPSPSDDSLRIVEIQAKEADKDADSEATISVDGDGSDFFIDEDEGGPHLPGIVSNVRQTIPIFEEWKEKNNGNTFLPYQTDPVDFSITSRATVFQSEREKSEQSQSPPFIPRRGLSQTSENEFGTLANYNVNTFTNRPFEILNVEQSFPPNINSDSSMAMTATNAALYPDNAWRPKEPVPAALGVSPLGTAELYRSGMPIPHSPNPHANPISQQTINGSKPVPTISISEPVYPFNPYRNIARYQLLANLPPQRHKLPDFITRNMAYKDNIKYAKMVSTGKPIYGENFHIHFRNFLRRTAKQNGDNEND